MGSLIKRIKNNYSFNNNIYLYILSSFVNYFTMSAFYNVLQGLYFKSLGLSEVFIGNVIGLRTVVIGLGSILAGILADKLGCKNAILAGAVINGLGYLGQAIAQNPVLIYLSAAVNGLGTAIIGVNEAPFLAENCPEEKRINVFSLNFVLSNFAFVGGAFIAGKVPYVFDSSVVLSLKYTQIIFAILAFLAVAPLINIKYNRIKCERSLFSGYVSILKSKKLSALIIYYILIGFGAGLVVPFFNIFLEYRLKAGPSTVGDIMSLSQIATIIGGALVPVAAKKYGRAFIVQLCQILSIPFLITISAAQSVAAVSICFFMRSALMNMASPAVQSLTMEMVEDSDRSSFSSIVNFSANITRGISASVAGFIMANISYEFPYYLTSALYIIAIWMFATVFRQKNTKKAAANELTVDS